MKLARILLLTMFLCPGTVYAGEPGLENCSGFEENPALYQSCLNELTGDDQTGEPNSDDHYYYCSHRKQRQMEMLKRKKQKAVLEIKNTADE